MTVPKVGEIRVNWVQSRRRETAHVVPASASREREAASESAATLIVTDETCRSVDAREGGVTAGQVWMSLNVVGRTTAGDRRSPYQSAGRPL
ncbi:uncharacterized protein BDCG_17984 [Blastomyces dermatitidis ER-3]|uniref:Uncharacterized protein n=1 Tax=Ajellomyces dermatitidis (strain ER-3 / ATCC MYA-2586) TaxID=559297 RepID=A0ABX2W1F2_AJEDR|nr:uncharacterized protein BDCG_17984 [Blastomyces dermatitidis ER-3]OAT03219.1 hypothetical protein BDCG_17984 [Blastomyces dermatitidis ER-3]